MRITATEQMLAVAERYLVGERVTLETTDRSCCCGSDNEGNIPF